MLLEQLRIHTSAAHQQLEKLLVPRIKGATTKQAYIDLLLLFYGYFKPLETEIDKYIDKALVPDYEQRRKADTIVSDINYLSGAQNGFKYCADLPLISNSRQAIGALYVMEGSTLGGKIIRTMLMKNLQLDGNNGLSFFGGYGDNTGAMWTEFTRILNDHFSDGETEAEAVTAANETFIKFKSWAELN
jgi:heme oxygenase